MKKVLLASLVGAFLLSGCGRFAPPGPPNALVWGLAYHARIVPAGTLGPYGGQAGAFTVLIDERYLNPFMVAHEVTHVWQTRHGVPLAFTGAACLVQPEAHCTPAEAHADAVALEVIAARCDLGDLGWPGQPRTACRLPDPAQVRP